MFWKLDENNIEYMYPNLDLLPSGTKPIPVCSTAWEWLWNMSHSRRVGSVHAPCAVPARTHSLLRRARARASQD